MDWIESELAMRAYFYLIDDRNPPMSEVEARAFLDKDPVEAIMEYQEWFKSPYEDEDKELLADNPYYEETRLEDDPESTLSRERGFF